MSAMMLGVRRQICVALASTITLSAGPEAARNEGMEVECKEVSSIFNQHQEVAGEVFGPAPSNVSASTSPSRSDSQNFVMVHSDPVISRQIVALGLQLSRNKNIMLGVAEELSRSGTFNANQPFANSEELEREGYEFVNGDFLFQLRADEHKVNSGFSTPSPRSSRSLTDEEPGASSGLPMDSSLHIFTEEPGSQDFVTTAPPSPSAASPAASSSSFLHSLLAPILDWIKSRFGSSFRPVTTLDSKTSSKEASSETGSSNRNFFQSHAYSVIAVASIIVVLVATRRVSPALFKLLSKSLMGR